MVRTLLNVVSCKLLHGVLELRITTWSGRSVFTVCTQRLANACLRPNVIPLGRRTHVVLTRRFGSFSDAPK